MSDRFSDLCFRPIFDKFDREVDGKQVRRYKKLMDISLTASYIQDGKIPLEKFVEILEQDQVWKDSVPQTLKDKIISEVRDGIF